MLSDLAECTPHEWSCVVMQTQLPNVLLMFYSKHARLMYRNSKLPCKATSYIVHECITANKYGSYNNNSYQYTESSPVLLRLF